jgi:hypothetical protein
LQDHSKMHCTSIVPAECSKNHKYTRECWNKAADACKKCEAEAQAKEKRRRRDHQLEEERQAKQRAYLARLVEIEDEIAHQKRLLQNRHEQADQEAALDMKRKDLENLKNRLTSPPANTGPKLPAATIIKNGQAPPAVSSDPGGTSASNDPQPPEQTPPSGATSSGASSNTAPSGGSSPQSSTTDSGGSGPSWDHSDAKDDWEQQKKFDGAENEALDALIPMVGK